MRCRINYYFIGVILLVLTFGGVGYGEESTFYEKCTDQMIERCESKSELCGSKSENLRYNGSKASEMAEFLKKHRGELVEEMASEDLRESREIVNHFLIRAYHRQAGAPAP